MRAVLRRKRTGIFFQLVLLLLWTLFVLPWGSSVEQQVKKVLDSAWADQALVSSFYPSTISNDGGASFQVDILGTGCPMGAVSLVFPKATNLGRDISIAGEMGNQCQTIGFRMATSQSSLGIRPGLYGIRLLLGVSQRPLSFALSSLGQASGSGTVRTNTTLVTVVRAATAGFMSQSAAVSRNRAAVTLSVGLDAPAQLPTSLGLRVWDPDAVEVDPSVLTWRAGEADVRGFTLRLTRAAPLAGADQGAPWAELVRVSNVMFASAGSPPRLEIQATQPAFDLSGIQAMYRSLGGIMLDSGGSSSNGSGGNSMPSARKPNGGSGGSDGNGSFVQGGGVTWSVLGSVSGEVGAAAVAVRRLGASPFASTLRYKAVLLDAAGCSLAACAAAVYGSGSLTFAPDTDSAAASLSVNWTALPTEAALVVGLQLTAVENADLTALPDKARVLYVYGTPYGTCPAGTVGPWQEPAAPRPPSANLSAGSSSAGRQAPASSLPPLPAETAAALPASSGQAGPWLAVLEGSPASQQKDLCNDTVLLRALLGYEPSVAMLPVLSACTAAGEIALVPPRSAVSPPPPSTSSAPPPPLSRSPQPSPAAFDAASGGNGGAAAATTLVELDVPFGQDAASLFIPLGSADETAVVLNSTCGPNVTLGPLAVSGAGAQTAAANSTTAPAPAPAPAAWVALALPAPVQPCYVQLRVYGSVRTSQGTRLEQGQEPPPPPTYTRAGPAGAPVLPSSTPAGPADYTGTSGGNAAAGSPRPPSPHPGFGSKSMPIVSLLPLRSFNLSLRPRSDPGLFSPGALSLFLLHRPSGRCLPLCGLPQPLLRAAGAAMFGSAFDAESASHAQLEAAAVTLAQAIRGGVDAVAQLQAEEAEADGGLVRAGGRLLCAGASLRRWLAAWLPSGWREPGGRISAGARVAAAVEADEAQVGRTGTTAAAAADDDGDAPAQPRRRRRLLQTRSSSPLPSTVPAPAPATSPSPSTAQQQLLPPPLRPPSPSPRLQRPQGGRKPLRLSSQGPPPMLPALPGPSHPGGPGPSYPGAAAAAAARAPDGFNMAGGVGGNATAHVLFNPGFVEQCVSWDEQVIDLALLANAPYNMTLTASSRGLELQVGTAGAPGNGGGAAGGVSDGAAAGQFAEVLLGPSTRSDLLLLIPQQQLQQQQQAAPGSPSAPLLEGSGAGGDDGGGDGVHDNNDCATRPAADRRLGAFLLAPDGVSAAGVQLRLYADYTAAAAAAVAAAVDCRSNNASSNKNTSGKNSSSSSSNKNFNNNSFGAGNSSSSSDGNGAVGGAAAPPATAPGGRAATTGGAVDGLAAAPLLPPPVGGRWSAPVPQPPPPQPPLWSACRPCGPGSFSDVANASSCQVCPPGSASAGTYNRECAACSPGTFTTQYGSAACRPCYAGSFASRYGSTVCTVCPRGTTSLTDGASECVVPPRPAGDTSLLVVSFQLLLNIAAVGGSNASAVHAISATGIDAPPDSLVKMLVAADTAAALRIPPSAVRVTLVELSPSAFLVNVSATMPLGQAGAPGGADSTGGAAAAAADGADPPSPEVDADTLINRLVGNPANSFPRTREATGGSLQVQLMQRRVVGLDDRSRAVNVHAIVWPTLAGTALLAAALGWAWRRHCRRRRGPRGNGGLSLPPITDALGRLCTSTWKYPTSPPATATFFAYGRFSSLELQELQDPQPGALVGGGSGGSMTSMGAAAGASSAAAPRHRGGRGGAKVGGSLPSLSLMISLGGVTASDSAAEALSTSSSTAGDLDAVTLMYTRDALAAPRI